MTNLSYKNILTLVSDIHESMSELKITEPIKLKFELDEGDFQRVDEDLFYHFNQGKNIEYTPSDDKTQIEIENITVIINKKGNKQEKKTWIKKLIS